MEIKILKDENRKLVFEIAGINDVQANTLRRLMVAETPIMAIEEIEIEKNDSALYDEILSHRLGLIPLTTDTKSYNLKEICTCKGKGCAKCQIKLTLETKGPKTVLASELKSKDPNIKPAYDKLPLVILTEGQEIKLIATAELGKGKKHMKFSPGIILYKHTPKIKLTKEDKIINKYKELIPTKAFKENKLDEQAIIENTLYEAIESISPELIKIEYIEDSFIFTIESFGQLDPKDIFKAALKEFDYKLDELVKNIKGSKKTIKNILKK
jgi:DNA-directed RNA polymerase subunit D